MDYEYPKKKKPPAKKPVAKPVKREPLYVATVSTRYRFRCDGTTVLLKEGVSPLGLTEAQTKELKKFKKLEEVK